MDWLKISKKIDKYNTAIGKGAAYLTLSMVLVTFLITVLRYVFKTGYISMQEAVIFMHSIAFLLPASIALRKGHHVRVDIFYSSLSPKKKAIIDMWCTLLILMPVMIFCLYISWEYVAFSWKYFEGSREANGLPGVFLLKTLLLIMPLSLILQGISEIIKNYMVYKGKIPSITLTKDTH